MKRLICRATGWMLALTLVTGVGCAGFRKPRPTPPTPPPATKGSGTTPVQFATVTGKVTLRNAEHAFVVVDFGGQRQPAAGTTLTVWRAHQPVGRVRLTEPARGRFVTADILEGEPRVGDEVR
jgi:hypothetical protein